MEEGIRRSDSRRMNKRVVAMCVLVGSTIGGYIIGSFLGGVAGVFAARSIDADF